MHEFLYAYFFRMTYLDLYSLCSDTFALNILMGIKLQLLPVSNLHWHISVLWLVFVFSLVIITDHMLWMMKLSILPCQTFQQTPLFPQHIDINVNFSVPYTESISHHSAACTLHTFSIWLTLPHPALLLPMTGHLSLSCWTPQYLHLFWGIMKYLWKFSPVTAEVMWTA